MNDTRLAALPLQVTPLLHETFGSYLRRLSTRNMVAVTWLRRVLTASDNPLQALADLSGYEPRSLQIALPELAAAPSAPAVKLGRACPACALCAAAHDAGPAQVFAPSERVLCRRHHRWIGGPLLRCPTDLQFPCEHIPGLLTAEARHHRLVSRYGSADAAAAFAASIRIVGRLRRCGVPAPASPGRPEIAAPHRRGPQPLQGRTTELAYWYPTMVAIARALISASTDPLCVTSIEEILAERISATPLRFGRPQLKPEPGYDSVRSLDTTSIAAGLASGYRHKIKAVRGEDGPRPEQCSTRFAPQPTPHSRSTNGGLPLT